MGGERGEGGGEGRGEGGVTYWVSALCVIAVLHTAIHLYMREGGREGERNNREGDTDRGMYTHI